jgi:hypothetical protein
MIGMKIQKEKSKKQSMKYWLVEFTLTSGEVLQFYVKALTQFDAYEKADGYVYWLNNKKLKNKLNKFGLMP